MDNTQKIWNTPVEITEVLNTQNNLKTNSRDPTHTHYIVYVAKHVHQGRNNSPAFTLCRLQFKGQTVKIIISGDTASEKILVTFPCIW
jgi:hypothetical protein